MSLAGLGWRVDRGLGGVGATGAAGGLGCGPAAEGGTGKLIVRQPLEGGAPGAPDVYFGLVPVGVGSVSTGEGVVPVSGNVFSVYDEEGRALPRLTYTTADGAKVTVDPLSAD